jgi:acyl CoA:acetate/3-ketoacid CoA transferase
VRRVDQITFSGPQALRRGQEIVYVTERAVFRPTTEGVALTEIAPGVDSQRDVLDRMAFRPVIPQTPATMPAAHFEQRDRYAPRR